MQFDSGLEVAHQIGQRAWPDVVLGLERFATLVRVAGVTAEDLAARAADLFLAYACADGDPSALQAFESQILARLEIYLAGMNLNGAALDEIRQRARVKLLVGDRPAIARYQGRGPLGAWVRVTTVRLALNLTATAATDAGRSADIDLLEMSAPLDDSPELSAARLLYRHRFQTALEAAFASLSPRDKTLLRLQIIDALSVDAIAKIYRVHKATVARWLVAIRSRIFQGLRKDLGLRQLASSSELRSLAGLLRDEIHLSAVRILTASH